MPAYRMERGAIVRCNHRTWIVWAYPLGHRRADPVALPVMPQTAPRHRSHVRLDLAGRAVLVHLLDPVTLPHRDCQLLGQCDEQIVTLLATSMQRAIEAATAERLTKSGGDLCQHFA